MLREESVVLATYFWPSRMKAFKPAPRPVTVALPPKATVRPESTALFPPVRFANVEYKNGTTVEQTILTSIVPFTSRVSSCHTTTVNTHTDDKIDLRAEADHEELVAHKLVKLQFLYYADLCDSLEEFKSADAKPDDRCHQLR